MSEISRFFGIIIAVYFNDHGLPHFHAKYGEFRGVFGIEDLTLLEGYLPKRVISLVLEWAFQHRDELKRDWQLAQEGQVPEKIEPLE
jgi:Domain of unknown function (DUF4160)